MILTCPACGTSYVIKDGAIPPHGRQVRCASCKHSWHQDGEVQEVLANPPPVSSEKAHQATELPAESAVTSDENVGSDAEQFSASEHDALQTEAVADEEGVAVPFATDVTAHFAQEGASVEPLSGVETAGAAESFLDWNEAGYDREAPMAPGRRGLIAVALLVLFVAALAAAAWFLAPREWMARAGLAAATGESPLKLMVTSQDRQKLASGNDLVSLSGRVINPTDTIQTVPSLQADLRDGEGKLVYSWTIAPPAPRLPPRGSASFNAAELGVPANATSLTLRWAS